MIIGKNNCGKALFLLSLNKFIGKSSSKKDFSFNTPSCEDLSRNIEFLYSKNRLNVVISEAQCLATVVINPNLAEANPKNELCSLVENKK